MQYKITILCLIIHFSDVAGQSPEPNSQRLESLDWDIMYCGRDKSLEQASDGSQCRFTTTDEFFRIIARVSGQDLEWFKNSYFKQAGLPQLQVSEDRNGVLCKWVTKDNMEFPMPLEVKTKNGMISVSFQDNKAELNVNMVDILEIDPNKWILLAGTE